MSQHNQRHAAFTLAQIFRDKEVPWKGESIFFFSSLGRAQEWFNCSLAPNPEFMLLSAVKPNICLPSGNAVKGVTWNNVPINDHVTGEAVEFKSHVKAIIFMIWRANPDWRDHKMISICKCGLWTPWKWWTTNTCGCSRWAVSAVTMQPVVVAMNK